MDIFSASWLNICLPSCSFLVEKGTWSIRFYMSFFRMVIQLRSTCRAPEAKKLTIGSFLIILYKGVVYLLVLIPGLCGSIQSDLKGTCPWNNRKNVDHLICPKNFTSEFLYSTCGCDLTIYFFSCTCNLDVILLTVFLVAPHWFFSWRSYVFFS